MDEMEPRAALPASFLQHRFASHDGGRLFEIDNPIAAGTGTSFWLENILVLVIFFLGTLLMGMVLGIWYQKLSSYFPSPSANSASSQNNFSGNRQHSIANSISTNAQLTPNTSVTSPTPSRIAYPPLPGMALFGFQNNNKAASNIDNKYTRIPNYTPPKHIAVIMDGNRRFGRRQHADPLKGHWAGGQTLIDFVQWCMAAKVEMATFYAFSTENWQRDPLEITTLMSIFIKYAETILAEALSRNMRVHILSTDPEKLPQKVRMMMEKLEADTNSCTGFVLNICLSYGGRREIVRAVQSLTKEIFTTSEQPSLENLDTVITEERISQHLLTKGMPEPDILIRTSGEIRLSNFLLWQLAYSECFFLDKCWPELTEEDFYQVLWQYHQRKRRFGT